MKNLITIMCIHPDDIQKVEKNILLFFEGVMDDFEEYAFSLHCAYVNILFKFDNKSDFLEMISTIYNNKDAIAGICHETLKDDDHQPFTNACNIVIDYEKMKQSLIDALDHSEYYFYVYGEAQ